MIITAEQSEKLLALDAYAISLSGRMDPAKSQNEPWLGRELLVTVTISGFGQTQAQSTPTWQASASAVVITDALEMALRYAPAQLAECNARAAGRLSEVLPEYDPDGTRSRKTRATKTSGPKLTADQLSALLGDLDL